jgi:hypothetical protein
MEELLIDSYCLVLDLIPLVMEYVDDDTWRETTLLALIGKNRDDFPRYRCVWLGEDCQSVVVKTRTGGSPYGPYGSNRREYKWFFTEIREDPLYLADGNWVLDDTCAFLKFSIPFQQDGLPSLGNLAWVDWRCLIASDLADYNEITDPCDSEIESDQSDQSNQSDAD